MMARSTKALAVSVLMLLAAGCLGRSPEVRHYMLRAQQSTDGLPADSDVAVLVGPVRLPAYLERSQLARLAEGGEVELDELNRWLGGFEVNFLRAISLGLAHELGSDRVVVFPTQAPFAIDYRIRLHVDDMIGLQSGALQLRVRWSLARTGEDSPGLFVLESSIPVAGRRATDLVAAHETALAELVQRMASEIRAQDAQR